LRGASATIGVVNLYRIARAVGMSLLELFAEMED
jgi:hypothetical protein